MKATQLIILVIVTILAFVTGIYYAIKNELNDFLLKVD